jgi:hypothetical protein
MAPNVTNTNSNASIGSSLDGFDEFIVCMIKCESECGIEYPPFDVYPKVDFQHVAFPQN